MADPADERRCAQCDARVGPGRFCANCGAPLGDVVATAGNADDADHPWRTDTAERPRIAVPDETPPEPAVPPQPFDVPSPPRFPMYADEVARPAAEPVAEPTAEHVAEPVTQPVPQPVTQPITEFAAAPVARRPAAPPMPVASAIGPAGTPGVGLWIGVAAVLLTALVVGGWLLLHGSGDDGPKPQSSTLVPHPSRHSGSSSSPQSSATSPTSAATTSGGAFDVAGLARASSPAHAPSGVDVEGQPVTFLAANLIDGSVETCWRRAGDASGTVLTIRLDQPTTLSSVGLVNGYAKIAHAAGHRFDWYSGNRRVLGVDWVFDDGSLVSQRFQDSRRMQRITIDPVTTSTVRIKITAVSAPGRGRAARNDTAISEVSLIGRPAS
jgi:hypothetical protein